MHLKYWIWRKIQNGWARVLLREFLFNNRISTDATAAFTFLLLYSTAITNFTDDGYNSQIEIGNFKINFWTANYAYAYGNSGSFWHGGNLIYSWKDKRPDPWLVYKVSKLLEKRYIPLDEKLFTKYSQSRHK